MREHERKRYENVRRICSIDRDLNIFVQAASIDARGVESLFSEEKLVRLTGTADLSPSKNVELFQNKPNPFDESTMISFWVENPSAIRTTKIMITELNGRPVKEIPVVVKQGMNEVMYHHGYNMVGTFLYTLMVDGEVVSTKKMVFAN